MTSTDLLPILRRCFERWGMTPSIRILVACSGGPDSMALLDLADRWRKEGKGFLAVGHVDHGLRGRASQADRAFVQRHCKERGLPFGHLRAAVGPWARRHKRGLEEAGRVLRYRALAQMARRFRCSHVATAHTLDDQAETVILNLLRGAGPSGLAGMPELGPWPILPKSRYRLLRPLLGATKRDLLDYLRARGIPFRLDPTNAQPLFVRNRLRPILQSWESERPGFFRRVAQTAQVLRDEEDYWQSRARLRRGPLPRRLERAPFLRYHVAEQRRRLRHLFGLTHFETLERVRRFAADRATGPLHIAGGRVEKSLRFLIFRRSKGTPRPSGCFIRKAQ